MNPLYVVISGTAASGKTTLAHQLGAKLGMGVIDKDDFLERLYDQHDDYTPTLRQRLSREADAQFIEAARSIPRSILVSFWARDQRSQRSGTPTEWLAGLADAIEVHCRCRPEIAARRFINRRRHIGHCDPTELTDEVLARFHETARFGPIGFGRHVTVDTTTRVDTDAVAATIAQLPR